MVIRVRNESQIRVLHSKFIGARYTECVVDQPVTNLLRSLSPDVADSSTTVWSRVFFKTCILEPVEDCKISAELLRDSGWGTDLTFLHFSFPSSPL